MRRPGGYLIGSGAGGTVEADTFTCRHCQKIVVVRPKEDPAEAGGYCYRCAGLVCKGCAGGPCTPFERRLEAAEARGRMLRDMGMA